MQHKFLREVCAETGVTRRAVQGYEKEGLVSAVGKNKYGYLLYDEIGVERIRTIRFLQKTGLSLRQIRDMIDAPAACQKEVLLLQVEKLETRRAELSELIAGIQQYIENL